MERCPNCGFALNGLRCSDAQRGRYYGIMIPILSQYTGYERQEMHDVLKEAFGLSSVGEANVAEMTAYMGRIERWAASWGIYIPETLDTFTELPPAER